MTLDSLGIPTRQSRMWRSTGHPSCIELKVDAETADCLAACALCQISEGIMTGPPEVHGGTCLDAYTFPFTEVTFRW